MKTLSIVVPVFQNEANLGETVPKLLGLEGALPGYRVELVLVDDGSTDRSYQILSEFRASFPDRITVVRLTRNFGQSPAIQAGLRHATGDCIGIISADLQEPYERFGEMLAAWENGAKFVLGERVAREDGVARSVSGNLYWYLLRKFAWKDFPRMGYDFCLLDRQLVAQINNINEKNTAVFQLIYWLGYRPHRIPMVRAKREKGKSQWSFLKKVRIYTDTLIAFTYLPVRLVSLFGLVSGALAVGYLVYVLGFWATHGSGVPGWMTITSLLLFFGASTLFSLGIVCEYLWRILDESRKRPPFVVDSVESRAPVG